jgi:hypothetical protein
VSENQIKIMEYQDQDIIKEKALQTEIKEKEEEIQCKAKESIKA